MEFKETILSIAEQGITDLVNGCKTTNFNEFRNICLKQLGESGPELPPPTPSMDMQQRYEPPLNIDEIDQYITDILVIRKTQPVPEGYHKLKLTLSNQSAILPRVYFAIQKGTENPVSGVSIIHVGQHETVPPGYNVINLTPQGKTANLHHGSRNPSLFLAIHHSHSALPVKDIDLVFTNQTEIFTSYFPIKFTPMGASPILYPDINSGRYLCVHLDFSFMVFVQKQIVPKPNSQHYDNTRPYKTTIHQTENNDTFSPNFTKPIIKLKKIQAISKMKRSESDNKYDGIGYLSDGYYDSPNGETPTNDDENNINASDDEVIVKKKKVDSDDSDSEPAPKPHHHRSKSSIGPMEYSFASNKKSKIADTPHKDDDDNDDNILRPVLYPPTLPSTIMEDEVEIPMELPKLKSKNKIKGQSKTETIESTNTNTSDKIVETSSTFKKVTKTTDGHHNTKMSKPTPEKDNKSSDDNKSGSTTKTKRTNESPSERDKNKQSIKSGNKRATVEILSDSSEDEKDTKLKKKGKKDKDIPKENQKKSSDSDVKKTKEVDNKKSNDKTKNNSPKDLKSKLKKENDNPKTLEKSSKDNKSNKSLDSENTKVKSTKDSEIVGETNDDSDSIEVILRKQTDKATDKSDKTKDKTDSGGQDDNKSESDDISEDKIVANKKENKNVENDDFTPSTPEEIDQNKKGIQTTKNSTRNISSSDLTYILKTIEVSNDQKVRGSGSDITKTHNSFGSNPGTPAPLIQSSKSLRKSVMFKYKIFKNLTQKTKIFDPDQLSINSLDQLYSLLLPFLIAPFTLDIQLIEISLNVIIQLLPTLCLHLDNNDDVSILEILLTLLYRSLITIHQPIIKTLINLWSCYIKNYCLITYKIVDRLLAWMTFTTLSFMLSDDDEIQYQILFLFSSLFNNLGNLNIQSTLEKSYPKLNEKFLHYDKQVIDVHFTSKLFYRITSDFIISFKLSPSENLLVYIFFFLINLIRNNFSSPTIEAYIRTIGLQVMPSCLNLMKNIFYPNQTFLLILRSFLLPSYMNSLLISNQAFILMIDVYLVNLQTFWNLFRCDYKQELSILFMFTLHLLKSEHLPTSAKIPIAQFFVDFFDKDPIVFTELLLNYDDPCLHHKLHQEMHFICSNIIMDITTKKVILPEKQTDFVLRDILYKLISELSKLLMNLSATVYLESMKSDPELLNGELISQPAQNYLLGQHCGSYIKLIKAYQSLKNNSPLNIEQQNISIIMQGLELIQSKESLKKGIDFFISKNLLKRNPKHIVAFIKCNLDMIDGHILGDYIGEGGDDDEIEFYKKLRLCYFSGMNFASMPLDVALRVILTQLGFVLPGEAQKIDRIIEAFSHCYYTQNANLYGSEDVIYSLSFSIIMLNTDAHNPRIPKEKKMKLSEFIKNNKGIDNGEDLPDELLEDIYFTIINDEIQLPNSSSDKKRTLDQFTLFVHEMNNFSYTYLSLLYNNTYTYNSYVSQPGLSAIQSLYSILYCDIFIITNELFNSNSMNLISKTFDIIVDYISISIFFKQTNIKCLFSDLLLNFINNIIPTYNITLTGVVTNWYDQLYEDIEALSLSSTFRANMHTLKESLDNYSNQSELISLRSRFPPNVDIFTTDRELLYQGDFLLQENEESELPIVLCLFTDILVLALYGNYGKLSVYAKLYLNQVTVKDKPHSKSFLLVIPNNEYLIISVTEDDKKDVKDAIQDAVLAASSTKLTRPRVASVATPRSRSNTLNSMVRTTKKLSHIPAILLGQSETNNVAKVVYFPALRDYIEQKFLEDERNLGDLFGYYSQLSFGDYDVEKLQNLKIGYPVDYELKWQEFNGMKYEDCFIKMVIELNKVLPNWKTIISQNKQSAI